MSDLPSHPESGPASARGAVPGPPIAGRSRRRTALIVVGVVGALMLLVVLHLTGVVGGESH